MKRAIKNVSEKMTNCLVTIVFVPHERFSMAAKSLESIITHTGCPYELICVDGNAPDSIRDYLRGKCQEHGFTLLRSNDYITPNEARNEGLKYVSTPYVVFVENDVLVTDGWLEALIVCAEETDAWLVGPLYLEEISDSKRVHMFGGEISFINTPAGLDYMERHYFPHKKIEDVADHLERKATGLLEFHTLLARREVFDKLGPLDTAIMNSKAHFDLCYAVGAAGGKMYLEPTAIITYITSEPNKLDADDLAYFRLCWSDAWIRASMRRICEKYDVCPSSSGVKRTLRFTTKFRRNITAAFPKTRKFLGRRIFKLVDKFLISPLELRRNRLDFSNEEHVLNRKPTFERVKTDCDMSK